MVACAQAQEPRTRGSPTAPAGAEEWRLVWSDEFDSPGLPDSSKWTYDVGGIGLGEQ